MTKVLGRMMRIGVVLVVGMAGVQMAGTGVSSASPLPTQVFKVRNFTPYRMVLNSYSTGNPYPEWVKPDGAGAWAEPAGTFEVGIRPMEGFSTTIKANFDNLDAQGKHIPLGQVEFKLEPSFEKWQTVGAQSIACWPSADVTCDPRGWDRSSRATLMRPS